MHGRAASLLTNQDAQHKNRAETGKRVHLKGLIGSLCKASDPQIKQAMVTMETCLLAHWYHIVRYSRPKHFCTYVRKSCASRIPRHLYIPVSWHLDRGPLRCSRYCSHQRCICLFGPCCIARSSNVNQALSSSTPSLDGWSPCF